MANPFLFFLLNYLNKYQLRVHLANYQLIRLYLNFQLFTFLALNPAKFFLSFY